MPKLTARLEDLYAEMWQAHRTGETPQPDLANLDVYRDVGLREDHEAVERQTQPDYEGWWRGLLAKRDAHRPVAADARLWSATPNKKDRT